MGQIPSYSLFYALHREPPPPKVWKIRDLFEILNKAFFIYYNSSKHLAMDEVIVLY
jgi:hypothetical protein